MKVKIKLHKREVNRFMNQKEMRKLLQSFTPVLVAALERETGQKVMQRFGKKPKGRQGVQVVVKKMKQENWDTSAVQRAVASVCKVRDD